MKFRLTLPVFAATLLFASTALADVIPLADGRIMQGKVVPNQITEESLAVRVFDTGGIVLVRWDLLLAERAKELRIEYGLDVPEEEMVTRPGHVVTLTNGTQVTGVVLNFEEWQSGASELRLKTPTGVQVFERLRVARVDSRPIDAKEAYTTDELYQAELAAHPPTTAAEHFALGEFCMRINDYAHAKEHFEAARQDAEFLETSDGKSLDVRLRRLDILLRAQAATDMVAQITRAMHNKDWNGALDKLKQLDAQFQDPQIRDVVGFDRLRSRVERGRDDYFKVQVVFQVDRQMQALIADKVKEKKPLRENDTNAKSMQGTLAGARMWAVRELPTLLWDAVMTKLGLEQVEFDAYWKDRNTRGKVQTASYGTGSFIVVQRATLPGGGGRNGPKRPAGSRPTRGGNNNAGPAAQAAQPKTDEEWWDSVRASDRAKWLEAYFAENSGLFNIVRTDETDLCSSCGGKGYTTSVGTGGQDSSTFCPQCNTAGKFKKVIYR